MKTNFFRFLAGALLASSFFTAHAQDTTSWKGFVQFTFEKEGFVQKDVKSGVEMNFLIAPNGAITGTTSNHCKIQGMALSPPNAPTWSLNLEIRSCEDKKYDGTYAGDLRATDAGRMLQLSSVRPFRMEVARITGPVSR